MSFPFLFNFIKWLNGNSPLKSSKYKLIGVESTVLSLNFSKRLALFIASHFPTLMNKMAKLNGVTATLSKLDLHYLPMDLFLKCFGILLLKPPYSSSIVYPLLFLVGYLHMNAFYIRNRIIISRSIRLFMLSISTTL